MKDLTLPWPSKDLHPNARVHWGRRAKAAKAARYAAGILALGAGWQGAMLPAGRLHVWIEAYPPDRRRRDADGLLSSLKSALDGISDVLGVDDSRFVPQTRVMDEVRKGGQVVVRITGGSVE